MKFQKKKALIRSTYAITFFFIAMLIAFAPVILANNYIRQDDLMWKIWPGMKMSDFGPLYYNTVFQLVRPICMVSFYLTDLISISIHNAVFIRFMSVTLLGICSYLLYLWQLKFNSNRILAASFAIAAFTLPAYQVFAATANYELIITSLVLTFGAAYCWYYGFRTQVGTRKRWLYLVGCTLMFASFMDYPLSSMYMWVLLTICYLNTFNLKYRNQVINRHFFTASTKLTLLMMAGYYVFCRLFHVLLNVDVESGRAAVIKTAHILPRLARIFDVLSWHANLWFWTDTVSLLHSPFFVILILIVVALIRLNINIKAIMTTIAILFALFFLAYSPVMATHQLEITFRYGLATMPILLYLIFWSINTIIQSFYFSHYESYVISKKLASAFFIGTAFFGVCYANIMTADGIVGPHQQEFAFTQQQLTEKVIPLLKQNKRVLIHAIACDDGIKRYGTHVPTALEYGMRTCQYQQQVISVIVHSLYKMGYESNYRRNNLVIENNNETEHELIVQDIPWGTLIVSTPTQSEHYTSHSKLNNVDMITIDTREMPPYQRFDFYKTLFGIKTT